MKYNSNQKIIGPCLYSCDAIVTCVNERFTRFFGFSKNELLCKSLHEIGTMIRINTQILLDDIKDKYSGYVFTKLLSTREVNISSFYNIETNEKIYTFIEKPNSRIDDKLIFEKQTLTDNIVGVAIYSIPDLIMVKVNQKYLDFHDSPYNEEKTSIGLSIKEIVTGYVGTEFEVITNIVIKSCKPSYLKEIKFDRFERGITYWDSTCTPIFEKGVMKYMMLITSESTERVLKNQRIELQNKIIESQKKQLKQQKKELLRSRYEFMNTIIDTFDLPVVRLAYPELKVVGINKKAFSIVKLLKPDIISINQLKENRIENLFEQFKPFDISKYHQNINDARKDKKTKYLNKKSFLIGGNHVYWNIIFEPIIEMNGEIVEILIIVIDVTEEIKANIVMEKTLKLQGEFLANISHELKTPLNVIFSAAQLFSMYCNNGSLDEKKDLIIKYIESIKSNSYRLSKLINNIVDSSKIEAGFFEINLLNHNIVEVVEDIVMSVTNFIKNKGLNIIFDTEIEEKIVACDPEKIERILLNLISNAIKFSKVGDEIFVEVKDKNEFIEISVKDTGVGIKEKHLNMIFDRFKQVDKSLSRNAEGSGIGLSLVKSIVELLGGSITVESEFGVGSKFIVTLPAKKVMEQNMLFKNNIRTISESIQVEFSDVS